MTGGESMIIEMSGVCKDYTQGKITVPALKNIDLQVEQGEYIAIMGPSGSGKTTLMNIIGLLDVQTAGSYLLDGHNVYDAKEKELATLRNRLIGFVFQQFHLLPKLSALDNVALPLLYGGVPKKERREIAAAALENVGLADRMSFRPNQLSGGQCQRVAIARAMAGGPKLLLADEPTGALDSKSGEQVMELFTELNASGTTVMIITHDAHVAEYAKKVYHIFDGELS